MSAQFIRESVYKPPVKKVVLELTPEQAFVISRLCQGTLYYNDGIGASKQCMEILRILPPTKKWQRISTDETAHYTMRDISQQQISEMAQK